MTSRAVRCRRWAAALGSSPCWCLFLGADFSISIFRFRAQTVLTGPSLLWGCKREECLGVSAFCVKLVLVPTSALAFISALSVPQGRACLQGACGLLWVEWLLSGGHGGRGLRILTAFYK